MIDIKKITLNIEDDSDKFIPFEISPYEKEVDIHIYANFKDNFKVSIISPNNKKSRFISQDTPNIREQIDNVRIKGETYLFDNTNNYKKIRVKLFPQNQEDKILEGKWKLLFVMNKEVRGIINIYIEYFSSRFNIEKLAKVNRQVPIHFDTRMGYGLRYGQGFEEELRTIAPNYEFIKISDSIGLLFADVNFQNMNSVETLRRVLSIGSIEQLRELAAQSSLSIITQGTSQGINANEEIGVNFLKNNPNISLNGTGVLIGIIDTGIDYLHPDFIYEDNTSKIVSIWDQSKDGNPPEGFYIGSEYTREDINQAIINNNNSLTSDDVGSGTMLAGICAGMGNANKDYEGVANGAELIVVKMTTVDGYYDNTILTSGYDYITKKARELQRPVIVNVGFGSNSRVGASKRDLNDTIFFSRGVLYVGAVGNEGNTGTHTSGRLLYNNDVQDIELEVDDNEESILIEIWVDRPDIIRASVVSPTGESTRDVDVSNYNTVVGILDLESTIYSIRYIFSTRYSGQQQIIINLVNVKKGTWRIRLTGQSITNGEYNAYLQNRTFLKPGTRFTASNPDKTVNFPATYIDNITVGAYDIITNSLWASSSRGNTVSDILKPDIVAPGVNIIAPFPGGGYATITGTAAAAAYTSGCIALLLQYTMVDGYYPNLGIIQKIRTYLRIGSTRFDNILYPNSSLGYGLLNIRNAFNELR